MNVYQTESVRLMEEVFDIDYFVETFFFVLKMNAMTVDGIRKGKFSNTKLLTLWNRFWEYLPDTESIRTLTFFHLCDMCDGTYDPEDDTDIG